MTTTQHLFHSREEAQAFVKDNPGYKVATYDPTMHCDYACLRNGSCRGSCPSFEAVKVRE